MQVKYQGRLVDSNNFRVAVYNASGDKHIAEGWEDYQNLLRSGQWFDNVPRETLPKAKKSKPNKRKAVKHGANSS